MSLATKMPLQTSLTCNHSFGNKSTSDPDNYDNSSTRLGTSGNTDNYSGATDYGSGTTGGAG